MRCLFENMDNLWFKYFCSEEGYWSEGKMYPLSSFDSLSWVNLS